MQNVKENLCDKYVKCLQGSCRFNSLENTEVLKLNEKEMRPQHCTLLDKIVSHQDPIKQFQSTVQVW
jgi:hypothetical protein